MDEFVGLVEELPVVLAPKGLGEAGEVETGFFLPAAAFQKIVFLAAFAAWDLDQALNLCRTARELRAG